MATIMVDGLAKRMADRMGHGMREKCYTHAQVAEEYFKELLTKQQNADPEIQKIINENFADLFEQDNPCKTIKE
jgi:hypothetical protein